MDDATGLAEALLGLNGFQVLAVEETSSEVIVTAETTADFVGCATCGARRGQGPRQGRHQGSPMLRAANTTGLAEAALALCRPRLRGQDLDREH